MFNFFQSIADTIGMIIDYVISLIQMVLFFITSIPKAVAYIGAIVLYLPVFLRAFVLLFISIAVILQIMNKGE
uniref:hypothetical protein n=1 Tax=Enterocloster clostridioformis TaxID=1531 RepID=UPI002676A384|nr:hypothetical protein [Enterocloster clostridioformis]